MRASKRRWTSSAGYSLIELMLVTGIAGVLSAIALVQVGSTREVLRGDAAMRVVLSQMNQARNLAIAQRRYMEVVFDTTNNETTVVREDTTTASTVLSTIPFEGGAQFGLASGIPDTPDAFGSSTSTSFTSSNGTFQSVSGSTRIAKFAPDGTLVDWNGQTTNGTVFVGLATSTRSQRAVTVLGSTGRIRGYRWDGRNWQKV